MSKLSIELKKQTLILYKRILRSHLNYLKEDMRIFGISFLIKVTFSLRPSSSSTTRTPIPSKWTFFLRSKPFFWQRWKIYYEILEKEKNLKNVQPNPVLYTKLDIEQMKTLNDIKETIEKK